MPPGDGSVPSLPTMNAPVTDRRKKVTLWILIPATALFLLSLLPAGIMIMFAPMAFDAGPKPGTWAFVYTLLAYPVVVLITITAAWIAFAKGAYRLAMWLNALPLIHAIVLIVEVMSDQ